MRRILFQELATFPQWGKRPLKTRRNTRCSTESYHELIMAADEAFFSTRRSKPRFSFKLRHLGYLHPRGVLSFVREVYYMRWQPLLSRTPSDASSQGERVWTGFSTQGNNTTPQGYVESKPWDSDLRQPLLFPQDAVWGNQGGPAIKRSVLQMQRRRRGH